jgi:hypothetical protein
MKYWQIIFYTRYFYYVNISTTNFNGFSYFKVSCLILTGERDGFDTNQAYVSLIQ